MYVFSTFFISLWFSITSCTILSSGFSTLLTGEIDLLSESHDDEDEKECIRLGRRSYLVGERLGITSCKFGSAMKTLCRV